MEKKTKFKTIISLMILILTFTLSYAGCSKQEGSDTAGDKSKNETKLKEHSEEKSNSSNEKENNIETNKKNEKGNSHGDISIPSAQCNRCKSKISKTLKKLDGVSSFHIDIDKHAIHVDYDKSLISLNKIEEAISLAGYDANNLKADPVAYSELDDCCKKPEDR